MDDFFVIWFNSVDLGYFWFWYRVASFKVLQIYKIFNYRKCSMPYNICYVWICSSWILPIEFKLCSNRINQCSIIIELNAVHFLHLTNLTPNSKHFEQIIDLNKPTNQLKRSFLFFCFVFFSLFLFFTCSTILFEQWSDFSLRLKKETKGEKKYNNT